MTLLEEHIDNTRKELLATAREQQMQGEHGNGQLQLG